MANDPADGIVLTTPAVDGALDELGAAITASPVSASAPRRFTRPFLALGLAAAMVVIGGGVAAGAVLSAHTGKVVPKAQVPMGGPGEELNPAAPDFRSVALQISADIPYPPGYGNWRELVVADASDPSGLVSSGALHGWFAMSAFCAWVRDWGQAVGAGDSSTAATAAQTIAQAPDWKAVTDEDPHPDPSATNDPGAETGTLFGWLLPYRDAVLAGDRARVEHLLASRYGDGRCSLYDPVIRAREAAQARAARPSSMSKPTQPPTATVPPATRP
jgi:hypothetical protein